MKIRRDCFLHYFFLNSFLRVREIRKKKLKIGKAMEIIENPVFEIKIEH
jgi:hypothetical protein